MLTLCILGNCASFFVVCWFLPKLFFFSEKSFRNTIRMSNSLDPDQAHHFVRSDLGLIWVQTVCKSYQQTTPAGKELTYCCFVRGILTRKYFLTCTLSAHVCHVYPPMYCSSHSWRNKRHSEIISIISCIRHIKKNSY